MNMSGIALRCEPGCHGFGHFDCSARWRSLCLMARSARCDVRRGSRRLRPIRRNACVGESPLFLRRFVGFSCRSAARTSRARIAPGSRRLRRHWWTKDISPPSSSARRRAIRVRFAPLASARSARIAPGSRRLRRHSGTKDMSPPSSSARRRAIRSRFSMGIGGTRSAGSKPKIRPKK
jgi:hypothetical protein